MIRLALIFFVSLSSFCHALTLSTIRAGVGRLVNETDESNSHCSASDRNYWINEWQLDTAVALTHTRKSSSIVTLVDVATYTLPSDFLYTLEAFYDQTTSSSTIKIGEIDQSELESLYGPDWKQDVSSDPMHYYFPSTNTIALFPAPNAANAGADRFEFLYVYAPVDLSQDSDSPDIPIAYHYQAQYYAAAQCAIKIGDLPLYDRLIAFYDRQRSFYKQRLDKRAARERDK